MSEMWRITEGSCLVAEMQEAERQGGCGARAKSHMK